ncbi:MAG TPA: hypothetical protein VF097_07245 [Actinomycetota bacterium]
MRCDEVVAVLPAFAGEEAPYPHDLEVHLQTCRGCADEEIRYRELLGIVRGLRDAGEPAPPGLALRVSRRAARLDVAWRGYARRLTRTPRSRYAAAGIGGAVVGATAIALILRRGARRAATS